MTKTLHSATFPAASSAENRTAVSPTGNTPVNSCVTLTRSGFELSKETAGGIVNVAFGEFRSVVVVMFSGHVIFGASKSIRVKTCNPTYR